MSLDGAFGVEFAARQAIARRWRLFQGLSRLSLRLFFFRCFLLLFLLKSLFADL